MCGRPRGAGRHASTGAGVEGHGDHGLGSHAPSRLHPERRQSQGFSPKSAGAGVAPRRSGRRAACARQLLGDRAGCPLGLLAHVTEHSGSGHVADEPQARRRGPLAGGLQRECRCQSRGPAPTTTTSRALILTSGHAQTVPGSAVGRLHVLRDHLHRAVHLFRGAELDDLRAGVQHRRMAGRHVISVTGLKRLVTV